MRFFMIYSNQFAVGNKPIGIGSLAAMLKKHGHQFELFDCTNFEIVVPNKTDWNLSGVKTVEYKVVSNPERLPSREKVDVAGMAHRLIAAIDAFKPDIVGLSALTDDFPLGVALMRVVRREFPSLPTVAGGIHATVDPDGVLAESAFDMVCVGEGEYVVLDLAQRIEAGRDFQGIPNLWVKLPDGRIHKNPVRKFEQNMDLLPFPDWSIYSETAFYKPFLGYVYKYGDFEMSRGCPFKCSYCINVQLQEIYAGKGEYHREKSISRVISEIKYAMDHYGIEFLKFWDETFLLMSKSRLEEFCDLYSTHIGLPYVIETTAQSITPYSAGVLRKTNCRSVSVGMETGSVDLRKGVLHKPTNNDAYIDAFALLEKNGVQKVSFNMIGLPHESLTDVFRTIGMNRLVGTATQAVGIFYPYKGTPIRNMIEAEGLMGQDFDLSNPTDYDFNILTAGNRSVLRFPDMDSTVLNRMYVLFSSYVFWPVKLFPLIDYAKNHEDEFAVTVVNNLRSVTYYRKFGDWPPGTATISADQVPAVPDLGSADANTFARLLLSCWSGEGREQVLGMLHQIADGTLKPDVAVPEEREQLVEWLGLKPKDEAALRNTRQSLRDIARGNIDKYKQTELGAD